MKRELDAPAASLGEQLRRWGAGETLHALGALCDDTAVFAVDGQRRILYWSPGAERLLGFAAGDVLGQHCLTANRCQSCMGGCGMAEYGELRDVPLTYYDAQGRPVLLRKSAHAFRDVEGAFLGGVEVLRKARAQGSERPPSPPDLTRFHGLVTRDPVMLRAFQTVRNVAETDATVLVRGESGSGKEWVARALHAESQRRGKAFVAINCAALTPSLIESELFGHVKGAFTGAAKSRDGLFAQADGGTLFLDEVAELPLEVQAKLLRVLEEGEVVPVGGNVSRSVDVRIVAATHESLREATARGRFREDLLYRLHVVPLYLPPLRERRGDIEVLLWHFIDLFNQRGPRRVSSVAPAVMRALLAHDFPGNVRELRNVVEFAFAVGRDTELTLADLPPDLTRKSPETRVAGALERGVDDAERTRLERALAEADGHVGKAAAALGMSRATFWRRRKKLLDGG